MDFKKINQIIELFKNSGLGEMSIELKDIKINMKSATKEVINYSSSEAKYKESFNGEADNKQDLLIQEEKDSGTWIKSPFVGTFYAAASQNDAPFVQVGQDVKEGETLFILEAMKVMNEIKASKSGKVLEIRGINGEMVEYDQKIILIGD